MAGASGKVTGLMSVSIVAGPCASAVVRILAPAKAKPRIGRFIGTAAAEPDELIRRIKGIAEAGETDHLILQCEQERPAMAYASLFLENDTVPTLAGICRLTGVAFAVESSALAGAVGCFVAEQIEFVNYIFIQPGSGEGVFRTSRSIALTLNPRAQVTELTETAVNTWAENAAGSFHFDEALKGAGWRKLLDGELAPSEDPRIAAFAYSAQRPFHPERFWNLLKRDLTGVFRAKGFFWLATRMDEVGGLNLAGPELHCSSAGKWWAACDAATREPEMPERTRKEWREPFGDRRQSFAVMALDTDRQILRERLDACLLSDSEMAEGEQRWANFADPFPSWSSHSHAHHEHECEHDHGDEHDCCHH